ncbi:hypothetical protein NFI96_006605 [Prochilodus magdalenae]|nr:hypothetical protein NFI96_006605 [Prochilodus magdalenae]
MLFWVLSSSVRVENKKPEHQTSCEGNPQRGAAQWAELQRYTSYLQLIGLKREWISSSQTQSTDEDPLRVQTAA